MTVMTAFAEQATAHGVGGYDGRSERVDPLSAKQVWRSFELKALNARFAGATSVKASSDSDCVEIEVDLSHVLEKPQGSLVIEVLVPSDYPQARPQLRARALIGGLEPQVVKELACCMASAMESALAVNGPAVFFSIDQAAAFLRKSKGATPVADALSRQPKEADKRPRRRRRQRKRASVLPMCEKRPAEPLPSTSCPRTKALGGGSLSNGVSTPSNISDASESSTSSSDDGSSSCSSGGVSDDEMKNIAA
ncbi:unnamed protein product, partial [Symbiodinium natans]